MTASFYEVRSFFYLKFYRRRDWVEIYTDHLFKRVEAIWQGYLAHPFVRGIQNGDLEKEKFVHYIKQDYVYLIEYSRLFALGVAKAQDLETMTLFSGLLYDTLQFEMALHRDYAKTFRITAAELQATEPAEATTSYTKYMLSQAYAGDVTACVASVLACAWSYHYIGKHVLKQQKDLSSNPYHHWINTYASEEFTAIADKCKKLINQLAENASSQKLKEIDEIFIRTSLYEMKFWDMADQQLTW